MKRPHDVLHVLFAWALAAAMLVTVAAAQGGSQTGTTSELAPGGTALIQPQDLLKALQSASAKPTVLYVGPRFLHAQAHIRGDEFIGPAAAPQSLDNLRKRVVALPKNSPIVLYCGCCPWDHCPNIRPAYQELQKLGFSKVKALYLPTSFGRDWVEKGYPVEKGE